MKFWFNSFAVAFFFVCCCHNSSAQIKLNLKKDFRAKGDGKTDDTQAFLNAAKKINELKTKVTLFIPAGKYIVHPQKPSSPQTETPFLPVDVLYLKDCNDISIVGEKGTVIRYAAGLYFGAFKKDKKEIQKLSKRTTDWKYRVAIGHGFNLENCSNLDISSVEIDGNNAAFNLGGEFGDVGMQIDNDGIFITDCKSINLSNIYLHHFGRDGLFIMNRTPQDFKTPAQNISLTNCRFEYNGRQGFSWCGGVGVTATNCSFNNTGKTKLSSPPGAGVDFEPNAGYIVKDGVFINCSFRNNNGVAVLADEGGFNVSNIRFKNCLMWGESSAAIWVKSPAFVFEDCRINGCFYFGCAARTIEEGTKFTRCVFTDINSKNNFLVESNGSKYLLFDQCTFRAAANGLMYIAADAPNFKGSAVIKDCKIVSRYKTAPKAGSFTTGVEFTGKTSFIDSGKVNVGWNLENSHFNEVNGTDADVDIMSKYMLASYEQVTIGTGKKEAKVNVWKNGLLSINTNARLIIGEESKLIIKKGGALWIGPGAELVIKGKIVAEEGAYLCIHRTAKISKESLKNIKLNSKVNFTDNPQMNFGLGGCTIIGNE